MSTHHDSRYETQCEHGHGWYFDEDGCAVAGCENAPPIEKPWAQYKGLTNEAALDAWAEARRAEEAEKAKTNPGGLGGPGAVPTLREALEKAWAIIEKLGDCQYIIVGRKGGERRIDETEMYELVCAIQDARLALPSPVPEHAPPGYFPVKNPASECLFAAGCWVTALAPDALVMARNLLQRFNLPEGEGQKLAAITLDALNAALDRGVTPPSAPEPK